MKKLRFTAFVLIAMLALAGCKEATTAESEKISISEQTFEEAEEDTVEEILAEDAETTEVDYDLTTMSSEMVYATVYQMLTSPAEYIGKTVRMNGLYYASYYDVTEQYYHYCIIADATACCSQGMEFVMAEEEDVHQEDYDEVVVTGTFGSYEELEVTYYCLLEATVE